MADEQAVLVSAKSNGPHEKHMYVEGSMEMPCVKCEELCWVSPYGQKMLAQKSELEVMCLDCSLISGDPDDIEFAELTDEQRAELHEKGLTDKDIDLVRRFIERQAKRPRKETP